MRELDELREKLENLRLQNMDRFRDEYTMTHSPRGIFLIINNQSFAESTNLAPRNGSNVDRGEMFHSVGVLEVPKKQFLKYSFITHL